MNLYSGVAIEGTRKVGYNVETVRFGLEKLSGEFTKDGLPYGYSSVAIHHLVEFVKSRLGMNDVVAQFPRFNVDDDGNIKGAIPDPIIVVKGQLGTSKELGIGRALWEDNKGKVYGFNQIFYFEFHVYSSSQMKCDQLSDQISLLIQMEKGSSGYLRRIGFQMFETMATDTGRGFRFGFPWDFRMQHQYARFFHTILVTRTKFDVVWKDTSDSNGIISVIVFNQNMTYPFSMVIGSSLAHPLLEHEYWDWHNPLL